jgi:hypothetical protein
MKRSRYLVGGLACIMLAVAVIGWLLEPSLENLLRGAK